eukprot:scaffold79226_cov64-Phaeocystis_antarctica.AAC.3
MSEGTTRAGQPAPVTNAWRGVGANRCLLTRERAHGRARDASTARRSAEFSVVMAIMVHRTHSRRALVSSYVPRRRASESLSYFRNATRPPTSAPCRMIATGGGQEPFSTANPRNLCFLSVFTPQIHQKQNGRQ